MAFWMAIGLQPATASKLTLNLSWVRHNLLIYFYPSSWFQIMLSISTSLALHLPNRYTAILWPLRLGRTISPKSLPICWLVLNWEAPFMLLFSKLAFGIAGLFGWLNVVRPKCQSFQVLGCLATVVQLEDPAFISKLSGRVHIKHDGGLALHSCLLCKAVCQPFLRTFGKTCQACSHSSCVSEQPCSYWSSWKRTIV